MEDERKMDERWRERYRWWKAAWKCKCYSFPSFTKLFTTLNECAYGQWNIGIHIRIWAVYSLLAISYQIFDKTKMEVIEKTVMQRNKKQKYKTETWWQSMLKRGDIYRSNASIYVYSLELKIFMKIENKSVLSQMTREKQDWNHWLLKQSERFKKGRYSQYRFEILTCTRHTHSCTFFTKMHHTRIDK